MAPGEQGASGGMLVVETIAKIRRLHFVQHKKIKVICRELGVSRKVVRKVLRSGDTEFHYRRTRQPLPKLGRWREELERLLEANEAKPSRERLTLIRVFEELRGRGTRAVTMPSVATRAGGSAIACRHRSVRLFR